MTKGGEFVDEEEIEFTDEESMSSEDGSLASFDSHGIQGKKSAELKLDLKMANKFLGQKYNEKLMGKDETHAGD